ncbi:hypothetical protein E5288_WYG015872 [Bos mutus]|uniref:Uncharacterized protein n=1 Tax=Bos mutus TaxID=72004 RepID=A0A6B0RGV6_9CETA|nr:hypothetical protein [Bos mutus]
MKRNCSFRVLKYPLNLKFYDSDETITLPENKIHTWLRSQQFLASATGCPGRQNTSGPCSWRIQPKTRQEFAAQTKVVTSKRALFISMFIYIESAFLTVVNACRFSKRDDNEKARCYEIGKKTRPNITPAFIHERCWRELNSVNPHLSSSGRPPQVILCFGLAVTVLSAAASICH